MAQSRRPDILFIMTDQQRFDTINALGNPHIYTPNMDRLVRRGLTFSRAYATCPVCVAARYTIRTGRESPVTRVFRNGISKPVAGQPVQMEERCGMYLARTMSAVGYRTFGVGKFHASPWNEDLGYEVFHRSEESYTDVTRLGDSYASWLAREHPEFDFLEQLMGERTEMYYIPQRSPLPAEFGVESWAAAKAIEQIKRQDDGRPYFGFISFIGPHPPFAPPIPFNRMYDPDRMPDPILGRVELDEMDEEIPFMRYAIWADAANTPLARIVKARYYGELTYIDSCLGKILDEVERQENAENTLICFFSDHGDLLGDHHGWQKQNFFEGSCRIPFLLSWPAELPANVSRKELVSLADLFAIATGAAGAREKRDGVDLLGIQRNHASSRPYLAGMAEPPGSNLFKVMILQDEWKYIFMANGGREQLFNLVQDSTERTNRALDVPEIRKQLYRIAITSCQVPGAQDALDGDTFRVFPYRERPRQRIYQFDRSRGVTGFPEHPKEVLRQTKLANPEECLGFGLKPGDSHYRAYVGPPERYDLVAAMSFNLLTTLGLRQHHTLLDIGCGSLRIARLLIPYLNQNKYVGIEPNQWLVNEGIRNEVGANLVGIKRPLFLHSQDPTCLSQIDMKFDFALAQSIFSHCGVDLIAGWLRATARLLAPNGALVATFFPGEKDNTVTGWIYPECVRYRPDTMLRLATEARLRFQLLDWRHPRQTWALFAAPGFDASWFKDKPLTWNSMLANLAKE